MTTRRTSSSSSLGPVSAMQCSDLWTLAWQRFRVRLGMDVGGAGQGRAWVRRVGVFSAPIACNLCASHMELALALSLELRSSLSRFAGCGRRRFCFVFVFMDFHWRSQCSRCRRAATLCQNANDLLNWQPAVNFVESSRRTTTMQPASQPARLNATPMSTRTSRWLRLVPQVLPFASATLSSFARHFLFRCCALFCCNPRLEGGAAAAATTAAAAAAVASLNSTQLKTENWAQEMAPMWNEVLI